MSWIYVVNPSSVVAIRFFRSKPSSLTELLKLCLVILFMCQNHVNSQRIDRLSCERRPSHTNALKTPGDNGFSIKIIGTPPVQYYEPSKDYRVVINGSYSNQQFLDFMLVATLKQAKNERQTAGVFAHTLTHMTKADDYCNHVMTSVTFHPSYKKSIASFTWTAPRKGSGCVIFKATVVEHPDIWFSDDGGLTKMLCEKPEVRDSSAHGNGPSAGHQKTSNSRTSHTKRQSTKCCACDVAKYEVTFVGNWSRESHPNHFPSTQYESLLHWSDIIGASHSPSYHIWRYDKMATTGVKEVCEYGWPRTLEGEIKQQGRSVRTVIKANGIWGYPALYTARRSARFSTDNSRPLMSLLTMIGPSPDWCVGVDSINMCLENCTWRDKMDLELYPWDAGTDSGVTYLSNNLATYPRDKIRAITNRYPNNTESPFYGEETVKPMATVSIRRVGHRNNAQPRKRCEAGSHNQPTSTNNQDDTDTSPLNPKCMTTKWSAFTVCSVTCGVGTKTRSRRFKHPMGNRKMCPEIKLQESDNCLGLVNKCTGNPSESVDFCVTYPWTNWAPCSVTCGNGTEVRTRQYFHQMGRSKCRSPPSMMEKRGCTARISDCRLRDWKSVCKMPADSGVCKGNFTRFFYDVNMKKCRPFDYGGCRGNQNKFDSMDDCQTSCSSVMEEVNTGGPVNVRNVDCMVTEWTKFSDCTVTCGTGLRRRSRMIKVRNSGNGRRCPKNLHDSTVCTSACPSNNVNVDCMLSEWSLWSDCTVSCGDGQQIRERMVKRPPQGRGKACDPNLKEMRACNLKPCDTNIYRACMLSEWSKWAECSVACGEGKRMRRRMVKRGPCPDDVILRNTERCRGPCTGVPPLNCTISRWSNWTECDRPCGVMGSQTRARTILRPALNGGSCAFEGGKQMEKRACYNGKCSLSTSTALPGVKIPIDCVVENWSTWSACSKTCGNGRQVRRRRIKQRHKYRGKRCPPVKETRRCETGSKCRRRRKLKKHRS